MKEYSVGTELKTLLKMLKLTRQWKQNVVCGAIFFVIGWLFIFMGGFNTFLGGIYFMIGGGLITQGLEQVFYSSYMNSSPKHKFCCTIVYPIMNAITFIAGYLIIALLFVGKLFLLKKTEGSDFFKVLSMMVMDMDLSFGAILVFVGIMGMIFYIYYSVASKNYIATSLTFFVAFFIIYMMMLNITTNNMINNTPLSLGIKWIQIKMPFGVGFVLGLLFLLVGVIIGILLRIALYKKPYSPMYKKVFVKLSK